jgi:hypothetical protein
MKAFQNYIAELNKVYEFCIKIAGVEPKGEVLDRIKNALDAYQVETISNAKRLPIQEHRDFPRLGPCECYLIEVALQYPTTPDQIRQLVTARAMIDPTCVCVYTKNQREQEDLVQERIDNQGAALANHDMTTDSAGDIAGEARVSSLMKELNARTYEFAAKPASKPETTSALPQNTTSPVGSTKNKLQGPRGK